MADYSAQKIDFDFEVDGDITKSIWAESTWSPSFVDMASGEQAEFLTKTAIRWSDAKLYVAFWAEEPDVRAEITQRDSLIFLENDLELFIDGGDCYYELEFNALNTIYEVFFIWRDSFPNPAKFPPESFDISRNDTFTFGGDYDRRGLPSGLEPTLGAPDGHFVGSICRVWRQLSRSMEPSTIPRTLIRVGALRWPFRGRALNH